MLFATLNLIVIISIFLYTYLRTPLIGKLFRDYQHYNVMSSNGRVNLTVEYKGYIFKDVNNNGTYSFRNVCVETTTNYTTGAKGKRIIVYNSHNSWNVSKPNQVSLYKKRITVDRSNFRKLYKHWDIYFSSDVIPRNQTLLPTTAFFVSPAFLANLYHFWNDQFIRLFSVIKSANRLHEGMNNEIVCNTDIHSALPARNKEILRTLYTTDFHDVFTQLPTNTCYSSAVFGAINNLERDRDAVDHVLTKLNVSRRTSTTIKSSLVIVKRTIRRITNIGDLEKAAKDAGYESVRIVQFESMPIKDQMTVAADTRVMVGVHGAGLQWAIFMPEGSFLVEISWPQKYWFPFYNSIVDSYNIRYYNLTAQVVNPNWENYKHFGKKSNDERLKLMNMSHTDMWSFYNVWKNADVSVDIKTFTEIITEIRIQLLNK